MNISVLTKDWRSNRSNYIVSSSLLAFPRQWREEIFEQKFLKWLTIIIIIIKKFLSVIELDFYLFISSGFLQPAAARMSLSFVQLGRISLNKISLEELKKGKNEIAIFGCYSFKIPKLQQCTNCDLHNF